MKTTSLFITALVLIILISNTYATDTDAIINQLITSKFRNETISEYKRLSNSAIEIFDNIDDLIQENPQLIENVSAEVNTSRTGSKIDSVKEVLWSFVDISISKDVGVGLVHFNDESEIDATMTTERDFLYAKIREYSPGGGTCIHCGINSGIDILINYPDEKNILLLSDGYNDAGHNPAIESADYARSRGIRIYTIALGNTADKNLLRNISNITNGKFYSISCEKSLKDVYRELGSELDPTVLVTDISGSMSEGLSIECVEYKTICGPGCIMNYFIAIMEPLYALAMILTGFYLMFLPGSPEGRTRVKSMLIWLMVGMITITVSKYIVIILFGISHSMTLSILSLSQVKLGNVFTYAIAYLLNMGYNSMIILERSSIPLLITPSLLIGGILLVLKLRYFMVLLLSVVFPFTIFLYSFKPTKIIGRFMMEQTILWIFAQSAMALVFLVTIVGINLTEDIITMTISEEIKIIMGLSGLVMLIMTPIIVVRIFRGFLP